MTTQPTKNASTQSSSWLTTAALVEAQSVDLAAMGRSLQNDLHTLLQEYVTGWLPLECLDLDRAVLQTLDTEMQQLTEIVKGLFALEQTLNQTWSFTNGSASGVQSDPDPVSSGSHRGALAIAEAERIATPPEQKNINLDSGEDIDCNHVSNELSDRFFRHDQASKQSVGDALEGGRQTSLLNRATEPETSFNPTQSEGTNLSEQTTREPIVFKGLRDLATTLQIQKSQELPEAKLSAIQATIVNDDPQSRNPINTAMRMGLKQDSVTEFSDDAFHFSDRQRTPISNSLPSTNPLSISSLIQTLSQQQISENQITTSDPENVATPSTRPSKQLSSSEMLLPISEPDPIIPDTSQNPTLPITQKSRFSNQSKISTPPTHLPAGQGRQVGLPLPTHVPMHLFTHLPESSPPNIPIQLSDSNLDEIMDAITIKIQQEYQQFYGS